MNTKRKILKPKHGGKVTNKQAKDAVLAATKELQKWSILQ